MIRGTTRRRGECGQCGRHRLLVSIEETMPWGERAWVCACCRDRLTERVVKWYAAVDRAVRRRDEKIPRPWAGKAAA